MSARGNVGLYVHEGDGAAIRAAVEPYLSAYNDDPTDLTAIYLSDVSQLDTDAIIAADPAAIWYAACDPDCTDDSTLYLYADGELVTAAHLDEELVIRADVIGDTDNGWDSARYTISKWDQVRGLKPTY
jgi:hypothetical protein